MFLDLYSTDSWLQSWAELSVRFYQIWKIASNKSASRQ